VRRETIYLDSSLETGLHVYEVRPRKDKCGVDLISDQLPFGRLWYGEPNAVANAIGYAKHSSRSLMLSFAFTMNCNVIAI